MSTYRKIHGRSIQAVTTDPTESVSEGQVWYNTTSDTFKTTLVNEAWASASSMISAKKAAMPGGIQTAAFTAGGNDGSTNVNSTFEYNGSGFSSGGNINTTRRGGGGGGTLTAGIISGGFITAVTNATEEYNGTSWTSVNNMNTSRSGQAAFGTQTANVISGGQPGQGTTTEEYDGTNWTTVNTNPTNGAERAGDGILTAGITFGGHTPAPAKISSSELYDGTNWTSGPSLNTARERLSGFGPQSSAYAFGGDTGSTVANTENYNGTSWSEIADMATARKENQSGQIGSSTAGVAMGGNTQPGTDIDTTEEFTRSVNVITAGAWASAAAMNTGRARFASAGGKDSALAAGGYTVPGNTTNTEKYDGTSWSETGNTPETLNSQAGTGSQTAAMSMSGQNPVGTPSANTITFDGSSWSSAPALNVKRQSASASSASPFNSVVMMGGYGSAPGSPPHIVGATEEYDGSSWTNQTAMPTGVQQCGGGGTQTAAIVSGGYGPDGGSIRDLTQFYDGSSWTTGPATLIAAQQWMGYAGTQTDNFIFGGSSGPASTQTARAQAYDGTAWSTRPSLGTGRYGIRGSVQGTTTSASAFGGLVPSPFTGLTNTEEFTGETTSLNVKTLTQS